MLKPSRSEGNQRLYDLDDLKKVLNIKLLNEQGLRISKIVELGEQEMRSQVESLVKEGGMGRAVNELKMAMLEFDELTFQEIFSQIVWEHGFESAFEDALIPLFERIGILWQTHSITPAHEHFVSQIVLGELHVRNARLKEEVGSDGSDEVYVFFLPENEIHELGLLYIHGQILRAGKRCIYLGVSVPLDNLEAFTDRKESVTFVTYMTVEPHSAILNPYVREFKEKLLVDSRHRAFFLGRRVARIDREELSEQIHLFAGAKDFSQNWN